MLEKKLQELTEATNRLAAAQEKANEIAEGNAAPAKSTRKKAPPKEEPEDEEEEDEEEETPPAKKKAAKKAAKKKTARKAAKKAKTPPPEEDEEEEEDDDEFPDEEEEDGDDVVEYKTVADHIRKTRERLVKAEGSKGSTKHKKVTKALLEEWGVAKVSEIEDDQLGVFFEELKGAEEDAGI